MAATAGNGELQIHKSLFCNSYKGAGLLDSGEHVPDNAAALIQHHGQFNIVLPEILHYVLCPRAVDLFPAGKSEVDIVLRLKALLYQVLGGGKYAVEGHLGIQSAPAPHDAVFDHGLKSGLLPVILIHRHHVIMGHQH